MNSDPSRRVARVSLAKVELANGKDQETWALATRVIADPQRDITQIDALLAKRGQ